MAVGRLLRGEPRQRLRPHLRPLNARQCLLVNRRSALLPTCREPVASLSPREREVASLVAEGCSNKQIARRLAISEPTVKDHVHRILTKTGCPNRAAVAAAYIGTASA